MSWNDVTGRFGKQMVRALATLHSFMCSGFHILPPAITTNITTAQHRDECLPLQIDRSLVHGHMEMPYRSIPRQFPIGATFKINGGPIYPMHEPMPPFVLPSLGH